MKKVTLKEIGEQLGLSKVTVFNALNNRPGISEKTKELVLSTAKKMHYTPANTRYKTGQKFIFAIKKEYFTSIHEHFYTDIYYYINLECQAIESSIDILFFNDDNFYDAIRAECAAKTVNGVFLVGEASDVVLKDLPSLSVPTVNLDFYSPLYNYNYVYLNNYSMAYAATNHLIENGHSEIGFIGDINKTNAICDRFLGYMKSLIQAGIPYNPDWLIMKNIEDEVALDKILPEKMPTAFVCHCDSAAYALYIALRIRNLSVPDDISVISFDNTDICKSMTPQLTSFGVSKERYAKRSMELMLDIINGETKETTKNLKPTLHKRASIKTLNM